jgi:hypothetical protein
MFSITQDRHIFNLLFLSPTLSSCQKKKSNIEFQRFCIGSKLELQQVVAKKGLMHQLARHHLNNYFLHNCIFRTGFEAPLLYGMYI